MALLALLLLSSRSYAADSVINISGTVQDNTCVVSTASQKYDGKICKNYTSKNVYYRGYKYRDGALYADLLLLRQCRQCGKKWGLPGWRTR